ncbi:bacteriophage abortive infection AbiH family protein [Aliidiomarina maris]|uniref:Abortive infection AbiH-like protein n=1 Tax=Aliidiomarina maris TaxID=531312 RepID=A0A327WVS5_9GAMM|nr:bacteriophage abortive infection AbiH family protein [Aliidiomarina maris]RAJ97086.1 abortive infection AbiH-like protein [Aliidiomarina maris]
MIKRVFIIGNGFDLHHGLPTRFEDFRAFVLKRKPQLVVTAEKYLCGLRGNWSNLEEAFANFDEDSLIDEASYFLKSCGDDDWSDSFHHDYQYEMNLVVKSVSSELKAYFYEWLCSIETNEIDDSQKLHFNDDHSLFLNFNYTPVLQDFYSIEDDQILQIHGSIYDGEDGIVLGHGWSPQHRFSSGNDFTNMEDVRVLEGQEIINGYFESTFKPTADILSLNAEFFKRIAYTKTIHVLGHSLSMVDLPYFKAVADATSAGQPRWYVSYYSESEKRRHQQTMASLGVDEKTIEFQALAQ